MSEQRNEEKQFCKYLKIVINQETYDLFESTSNNDLIDACYNCSKNNFDFEFNSLYCDYFHNVAYYNKIFKLYEKLNYFIIEIFNKNDVTNHYNLYREFALFEKGLPQSLKYHYDIITRDKLNNISIPKFRLNVDEVDMLLKNILTFFSKKLL